MSFLRHGQIFPPMGSLLGTGGRPLSGFAPGAHRQRGLAHRPLPPPDGREQQEHGKLIGKARESYAYTHIATEPGVYRVEVWRSYLGRKRGWIFSNPIYVR